VEPSSSLGAARRPRRTHGRWSTQFAAGAEGVLQTAVEAFYQPVGLRVVGSSLVVLDVEQAAEGSHREEVNWDPRSDVMTAGTPDRLTHP
jgi:hypothetical protein